MNMIIHMFFLLCICMILSFFFFFLHNKIFNLTMSQPAKEKQLISTNPHERMQKNLYIPLPKSYGFRSTPK